MGIQEPHLDLIGAAYDAVAEPQSWPDVLARLCRLFNAAGVYTALARSGTNEVLHSLTYELPTDAVSEYDAHVIQMDPRVACMASHPEREIFFDYLHTSEQEMRRDSCYAWLRRVNGLSYYVGYRAFVAQGLVAFVSLQRVHSQGHAAEDQIRLFSRVAPHLNRALQLTAGLEQLQFRQKTIEAAIDRLTDGVFVLDDTGRVLYCNAAADGIAAARDGLSVDKSGIKLVCPRAHRQYAEALAGTVSGLGSGSGKTTVIAADRSSGKRAYAVWMTSLPRSACGIASHEARAMVFVTNPDRGPDLPEEVLRCIYGLTRREADLALQLAHGLSLGAAAERLGVRHETARSYLKSIFSKTQVCRQGELVRLIWSLAAVSRAESDQKTGAGNDKKGRRPSKQPINRNTATTAQS